MKNQLFSITALSDQLPRSVIHQSGSSDLARRTTVFVVINGIDARQTLSKKVNLGGLIMAVVPTTVGILITSVAVTCNGVIFQCLFCAVCITQSGNPVATIPRSELVWQPW